MRSLSLAYFSSALARFYLIRRRCFFEKLPRHKMEKAKSYAEEDGGGGGISLLANNGRSVSTKFISSDLKIFMFVEYAISDIF